MSRSVSVRFLMSVLALALFALAVGAAGVKEMTLPNGLTVLVKEAHAAPVATVDVWYKVGARNEAPGQTGMSHLLEHMTYKGTKEFGKDAMKALAKRNGAIDNGATFYDYTHYYTTIASDRVDLALRLEASRMSSALIRQADLDSEMTVVRSELEGRENNPGSLLFTQVMAAMFTAHPYQWPVIGWRADVEHMTADQLRTYYRTYYVPNNATLVVAGDVNAEQVFALARKRFGALKRGPEPPQWVSPEPEQRGERRVIVRRQGQLPLESITWHIPSINHPDIPALMMLEQILGSGRMSRLYQRVVETQLGVGAWASSLILRDPGVLLVGGAAAPGQPMAPIEEALLAEVEGIKAEPPTAAEMARARRQLEASIIFQNDSVTQQAEQLGYYATVAGNWRYLEQLPGKLQAVTAADIARVAKTYLTADNRTIGVFEPASAGTPTAAGLPAVAATPAGYRDAAVTPPLPLIGQTGPAATVEDATGAVTTAQPKVERRRFMLPNGMVLIVQENHANPTVAVRSNLKAGKAYDPAGKTGLADMTANMLDRGTTTRTSNQIAEELEGAAADISAGTGWETVGVQGKALSGDVELLIRNMADLVRNPSFPADEIAKMREQMLADLAYNRDAPDENARRAFYRAALPAGHPYRMASLREEEQGVAAITRDDILAFHRARYTPGTLMIAVVGDVQVEAVRALVERYFGDWEQPAPEVITFTPFTPHAGQRVVTYIPDKSEVSIYAGHAGELRRTDPDYYAAQIMNLILGGGGALNSRLGDVIRDQHGLAYTVYSAFHASTGAGPWYAAMGVNPKNVDKAVELLQSEIARMRDQGVTPQEVDDAISFLTGAYAIALETNTALAAELMDAEYFGLGLDYPEQATAHYRAVTREQVNAAAKHYLHPERVVISIAGPYTAAE